MGDQTGGVFQQRQKSGFICIDSNRVTSAKREKTKCTLMSYANDGYKQELAFSGTKRSSTSFFPSSLDRAAEHASQSSGLETGEAG